MTGQVHVFAVDPIMRYASSANEKNRMTKSIPKGEHWNSDLTDKTLNEPPRYVEMLEQQQAQLVDGLQELYRRLVAGEAWTGSPLVGSNNGHPLTHDILQAVGAFNHDSANEYDDFEDNLNTMQQRLLSTGSIPMRRRGSGDSDSDHESSQNSFVESPKSAQSQRFPAHRFPPTPPLTSPCLEPPKEEPPEPKPRPQAICLQPPILRQSQTSMNPAALQRQAWAQCPLPYDTSMDFLHTEAPIELHFPEALLAQPTGTSMPMVDMWTEDDFQCFMDTSLV